MQIVLMIDCSMLVIKENKDSLVNNLYTLVAFGIRIESQLILLFNLFMLLFMDFTALFGIIPIRGPTILF